MCFKFPSASTFSEPSGEGVLFSIVTDKERSREEDPSNEAALPFYAAPRSPACLSAVSGIPQPFANLCLQTDMCLTEAIHALEEGGC